MSIEPGRVVTFPVSFLLLGCAGWLSGCAAWLTDDIAVTPQRPTVSSDTSTTAEGTLELETGAVFDPEESIRFPTTFKAGIGPATELFVGLSPYDRVIQAGPDAEGFGDTFVGVRHRAWSGGQGSSAAVQLATKLPTADEDEGLGTGELDFGAALIGSHAFPNGFGVTAFYEWGLLGDPVGDGTGVQHVFALAVGRSLPDGFGLFAELARIESPFGGDPLLTTVGVSRAIAANLVLDGGLAIGWNDAAPDALVLVGLTWNLGVFGERR